MFYCCISRFALQSYVYALPLWHNFTGKEMMLRFLGGPSFIKFLHSLITCLEKWINWNVCWLYWHNKANSSRANLQTVICDMFVCSASDGDPYPLTTCSHWPDPTYKGCSARIRQFELSQNEENSYDRSIWKWEYSRWCRWWVLLLVQR